MPDILNEDGSCTDIKTITKRNGDEMEFSFAAIDKSMNAISSFPSIGGKSFAKAILSQQNAIANAMQIPIPYLNTMSQMSVVQSRSRLGRTSFVSARDRYIVNGNFPYNISIKEDIDPGPMEWLHYYVGNDKHYETRLEAEKGSLTLLIKHHKKQLQASKVETSKFSRKKRAFTGYNRPNSSKFIRAKKAIEVIVWKLDNIEEEHPEWMI